MLVSFGMITAFTSTLRETMPRQIRYRNLPQLFLRGREELLRHFRPIITHFGLTEQQWRILRAISENDQLEPREICEICQILSPSLTGVLTRMEDMGLVTRTHQAGRIACAIGSARKALAGDQRMPYPAIRGKKRPTCVGQ